MRRILLATGAAIGVLAAGCTNGTPQAVPSSAATSATPKPSTDQCPAYGYGKECAEIGDFDTWFKTGWVDVSDHVPFEPSPDGTACSVPLLRVSEGPVSGTPARATAGATLFTVTPTYEKYRYGDRNQYQDTRRAGVAFTAEDGTKYVARFDYDNTFYKFTRGYPLVFRPCPEWAQG